MWAELHTAWATCKYVRARRHTAASASFMVAASDIFISQLAVTTKFLWIMSNRAEDIIFNMCMESSTKIQKHKSIQLVIHLRIHEISILLEYNRPGDFSPDMTSKPKNAFSSQESHCVQKSTLNTRNQYVICAKNISPLIDWPMQQTRAVYYGVTDLTYTYWSLSHEKDSSLIIWTYMQI